ncbi:DUF3955 domain-containing protein [Secundilactobacillus silagei]|uniref:XRE family transcriptional regulator n=1 Tax=Secundilactobacillus silagei JCM 19001 TaxID=1302250 RepID=A0A1Z5IJQ5_9LACO|nr:DUF3955 domain-containing protein [Secundilactobacillus silagei]TDG71242.1 hypothetical protein C5L25_001158 [Secundilactobacillus silagei JCM 19001]GAX02005.1 XRE family transcriptional regulator [Secundilactobacillus silagei JCM 19001]
MVKARLHRWTLILGIVFLLAGVSCFIIRFFTPEYIGANGVLHESFYLVILGYAGLFIGLIFSFISFLTRSKS